MNVERIKFLVGLLALITGVVDIDWMLVAPRFNLWYYTVDYWEFCPFVRVNWWIAYIFTLLRVVGGAFILGYYYRRG